MFEVTQKKREIFFLFSLFFLPDRRFHWPGKYMCQVNQILNY